MRHNWLKAPIVVFLRVGVTSSDFQGGVHVCIHTPEFIYQYVNYVHLSFS